MDSESPAVPGGLAANATSNSQIALSWMASTDNVGVTGYLVERCTGTACANFAQISQTASTALNDTGLAGAADYSYRVRATDAAGNLSGYSGVASASTPAVADTTPPTAPGNAQAAEFSVTQINLAWTASSDNLAVTGYLIERCQGSGCTNFVQIASSTATGYSNTGLTASTTYSYRIRATDAAGNLSGYSQTASAATADTTPPTAPANALATALSTTQINVAWTAASDNVGVTQYLIERCQGAGCTNFVQIGTAATASYSNSGLTAATAYSYRVRAADAVGNLSAYSNLANSTTSSTNISISVTPVRGGLTVWQTLPLTATLTNDVGAAGVIWSATAGSFSAQTTTSATFVPPAGAGQVTITATSAVDSSKKATVILGVTDLAMVGTYHNDGARSGANTREFALTTANVNTSSFGKLFSCQVDGSIYAQPLWISNLTYNGQQHNVVIVATQHDSVYAFDADTSPCVTLWKVSLLDGAHGATPGETTVPSGGTAGLVGNGYGDIKPEVGISGTPVIDPVSKTLYVVGKTVVVNPSPSHFYQRLHGLSLLDGSERGGSPATIDSSISVAGTGDGSTGSQIAFNAQTQHQRPGLALVNGVVYVAFASHEDKDPYHGWILGFDASTFALPANEMLNLTPNHVGSVTYSRGGIWMSGGAPAVDAGNNVYLSTGNGTFDANTGGSNFGDSTLKLSTGAGLAVADWFTPYNQSTLDAQDQDHGSGGAVLLVNTGAGNYIVAGGKAGTLFVLLQSSLGHYSTTAPLETAKVHQELTIGHGVFSTAAFWNNSLFIAGAGSGLQSYSFNTTSQQFDIGATSIGSHAFNWPGASASISASDTSNGIAWAMDTHPYCTKQSSSCGPAVLYAMDATHLSTELWNSSQTAADAAGNAVKFTVPTVANGRVYIGTRGGDNGDGTAAVLGELDVYGLKAN